MKSFLFILFVGIVLPIVGYAGFVGVTNQFSISNQGRAPQMESHVAAIQAASNSVVAIHVTKKELKQINYRNGNIFTFAKPETSNGSGVIVDYSRRYVVTNFHVVDQATAVFIELSDGRIIGAQVLGTDPVSDIALLEMDPIKDLPTPSIDIGRSNALQIGDTLYAVGNPYGAGQAVTRGILSAKSKASANPYIKVLQTDARIFHGNSGGALIDSTGKLVGITSGFLASLNSENGLSYAIPIELVQRIVNDLATLGKVNRGWVGSFSVRQMPSIVVNELSRGKYSVALQIRGINRNTPLANSQMQPGDLIVGIDTEIANLANLENRLISLLPYDELIFNVLRYENGIYIDHLISVVASEPVTR